MKTLLAPIDLSDTSAQVIAGAATLATQLSGSLILLHVIEPIPAYVPVGATVDILAPAPASVEVEDTRTQHEHLEALAAPLRSAGLDVKTVIVSGLAVDDIVAQADALGADCIVLGSHGHGALYHLFSGSVVTGVLKHAKCPVLVIPASKK